jgi:aldose sugar dehydrogenase
MANTLEQLCSVGTVEVAPDGAVWLVEDANPGGLFRVTPK